MRLEKVLAAHELAHGSPEFWRCACGFVSNETRGRGAINAHRAEAIREWLTSEAVVDPLVNIEWAIREMFNAMAEGRYRYERVHVEADLRYLLAESRRARAALTAAVNADTEEDDL